MGEISEMMLDGTLCEGCGMFTGGACDHAFQQSGQRPHVEQRGNSLVIMWPDGEETNQIDVERIQ